MKNSTNKILTTVILITVISFVVNAQTNVSGGIFANTTWTLANSPYIVVDTTVVFPGVTLTIEPGVVVKFDDHIYLEIRQATLIANGTITDSITFTSNNPSPTPGIWGHSSAGGIFLSNNSMTTSFFNFCNISYAVTGLVQAMHIKNSTFTHNETGIYQIINITVDSCIFRDNVNTAISSISNSTLNYCIVSYTSAVQSYGIEQISSSTFNHCTISNNYYGAANINHGVFNYCLIDSNYMALGEFIGGNVSDSKFHHCSISHNHQGTLCTGNNSFRNCIINSNTTSGLGFSFNSVDSVIDCEIKYNGTGVVTANAIVTQCDFENDTVGIYVSGNLAHIYCNKICNNIFYGLKLGLSTNFNVANNYWCTNDSTQIAAAIYDGYDNVSYGLVTFLPTDSTCNLSTGIAINETNYFSVAVFPNPVSDKLNITVNNNTIAEIILYDIASRKLLQQKFTNSIILNTEQLAKGIYIYEVRNKGEVFKKGKVVKD